MTKTDRVIQRKIGAILSNLETIDREILEKYLDMLEDFYENMKTSKPKETSLKNQVEIPGVGIVETSAIKTKKPRGSAYFSEEAINSEIFRLNKDKVFVNSSGVKFHLTNMTQVLNLKEEEYTTLRKRAISSLHAKK